MSNRVTVVAGNFKTFVEQTKKYVAEGYGACLDVQIKNGFFRAVLGEGEHKGFISKLNALTGDETAHLPDVLSTFLEKEPSKKTEEALVEAKEIKESVEETQTKAVPKKTSRKRKGVVKTTKE